MSKRRFNRWLRSVLVLLVLAVWFAGTQLPQALADEPAPDRPSPPPGLPSKPPDRTQPPRPERGESSSSTKHSQADAFNPCYTVRGVTINWGYRNEPKLPVTLSGPGWRTQKVSDDNGYYASDCLGLGITLLNPVSPPWLRPMTSDVAVRSGYHQGLEVNLGLYGPKMTPLAGVVPTISVTPKWALPGQTISYTIQVTNTLRKPDGSGQMMGQVMVTDLLPEVMHPVAATSTAGTIEWWGNLLTVDVGELPPDQVVTIILIARLRDDMPVTALIPNRVSLIYSGHVAVQASVVTSLAAAATGN